MNVPTNFPRLLRHLLVGMACLLATPSLIPAQSKGPDLLGISFGMPAEQARKVLQAHSPLARVTPTVGRPEDFSLTVATVGSPPDQIEVSTTDPARPPVVWFIRRTLQLDSGVSAPMATSSMMDALRQKYGKETLIDQRGPTFQIVSWLFDQNGRLVPSADRRMLNECHGYAHPNLIVGQQAIVQTPFAQQCFSSYVAVRAELTEQKPGILTNAMVALVNLPMAYQARLVVTKAQENTAEKARQEELEKARQNRPKF